METFHEHVRDQEKKTSLILMSNDETMKLLWLMGVCPLVVTHHDFVRRAVKLCQNMVVLSAFPEIFANVVRKFGFSMQGKDKIALENLVQVDR